MLLMDEATSNVDAGTGNCNATIALVQFMHCWFGLPCNFAFNAEIMVNAAARKAAARGACVIAVTHRVKSALDADHVSCVWPVLHDILRTMREKRYRVFG